MKLSLQSAACVLVPLICLQSTSASLFHNTLNQHKTAYDKAFHKALLKQLSDSRKQATISNTSSGTLSSLDFGDDFTSKVVQLASTTSNGSFADSSTSSFQIYTSAILPTSPAPSTACANALTAVVSCNSTVPLMSSYPYLLINDLASVCTTNCTSSLASYRANVVSACGSYKLPGTNNASYLPTLAVDTIAGPYNTQCLLDPTSKQFCEPLLASFNTTGGLLSLPTAQLCTFCTLKTLNVTLSNPATYSVAVAQLLSSAVTECGSQFTSYNVTSSPSSAAPPIASPPPFGVNSTTGGSTDCAIVGRNVTTTANTTCSAVAQQFSVGLDSVFDTNPFLVGSSDCSIPAQTTLCLLKTCTTYTVKTNDTCISVAAGAGAITGTNITSTQLQSFNPDLGTFCQLMSFKVGQTICLTPNGGFPNIGVASNGNPSATPTVKATVPTPTVSGTTSNCGRYYQVQVGDVCNSVVLNNTISLPDFLTLNPEIDDACSNLWLGYYYCVAPFPPLTTTSAIPVITATANATSGTVFSYPIPTANYTQSFVTQTFAPAGVPAPTNVAVGTKTAACGFYYNVTAGDTIQSITASYALNASTLITWNPELQSGNLTVGSAICVLFPTGNYTLPPAPVPANVAANITTSLCAEYYTVQSGDSCPAIEAKFFIANSDFLKLNPSINTACTNIIAGVAYCVLSVNPPGSTTAPAGPPTNVAPGTITSGCTQYYTVVSGDSCGAIETKFTISDTLFHAMNPELSTSCTNIIAGDAYCVATSNTTAPTNVATGTITSGCIQYYTIASGDSCGAIETKFNVTDSLFHTMNPEINTGCTNILLGEAYCVKTTNTTTAPPTGPPSNLATGSLANCTTYYTVASGDSCTTIDAKFKIAFADFLHWNPEVNTACTNIFGAEAYCVGGGGNPCPKIYTVVSGDFCSKIQTSQGISNATMYALNPWLDHNCDLNVGQNICV